MFVYILLFFYFNVCKIYAKNLKECKQTCMFGINTWGLFT